MTIDHELQKIRNLVKHNCTSSAVIALVDAEVNPERVEEIITAYDKHFEGKTETFFSHIGRIFTRIALLQAVEGKRA
jgi:hypothetical protein